MLVKTFPALPVDSKNPARIGDGNDHWVISLAYFCMASVATPRSLTKPLKALPWMRSSSPGRRLLGSESCRSRN